MGRQNRARRAALLLGAAGLLLASCTGGGGDGSPDEPTGKPSAHGDKPNIVYVLTDDLSWNLVKYMPHVQKMRQNGTTFTDFYVTDSLCCPSRSSILTGEYPHNTGVFTNTGDDGGYGAFMKNGDEDKCFGPALQKAGYRTGFMGKYLNGYQPGDTQGTSKPYVPPGWDEWDVAGSGYAEYNYNLNENGKVAHYRHRPQDYLTDVVSHKATSFVDAAADAKKPFMLELATFAPHGPSTPAPRDVKSFPGVKAPREASFDKSPQDAPAWQRELSPLAPKEKKEINRKFALRVRSVQAVDRMIGHLEDELKAKGLADDTYLVFNSDNGFHMGEHRLRPGKQTAFDTDINVPLVVTGPGVPAGKQVSQLAENVDMNPTFQDLAGLDPPASADGTSLTGLMRGGDGGADWRKAVLVEHHHAASKKGDPDAAPKNAGDPPSYEALRTKDALYVEYADGEREYYETGSDTYEMYNRWSGLPADDRARLHDTLTALKDCKGADECRKAAATDASG
ncbi:sulfatase [Streptomyces sp. NPDC050560]|uniref:sulfatase n=1 Tax=Streptomyces sp. NPDC050560 TaxID=3365630 RepID=UPI0037A56E2F